jgi:hypothetical protein
MHQAAVRAAELGDTQMEGDLKRHIDWVTGPDGYDVTDEEVYAEITAAASEQPQATFEGVVSWLQRDMARI